MIRRVENISEEQFDTDMKEYAEMYRHLGCELYHTVTADNGVTRYSLCYKRSQSFSKRGVEK